MKRAARILVASALTGFLLTLVTLPAQADPGAFFLLGNEKFEAYRAPWPEREKWYVGPIGKGAGEHSSNPGQDRQWAIDLESPGLDCQAPLRADRNGELIYFDLLDSEGYGNLLGIKHSDGTSSWYAHLDVNTPIPAPGSSMAQGEFAALVDDTGESGGCHLHLQVHDNHQNPFDGTYNTINICLGGRHVSGTSPCPDKGYDLQHLTDQRNTTHPSNNTGPGYGRPGAPAHLDPGPEAAPLRVKIQVAARNIVAQGNEPGSTFAALQGACAANRNWVKTCPGLFVTIYTQNFLVPVGTLGGGVPQSITEGPSGLAFQIRASTWKVYGRQCGSESYVYEIIGRPINNEWGGIVRTQNFEFGHMTRDDSYPFSTTVNVYGTLGGLLCSFSGLSHFHTGFCPDVDANGIISLSDLLRILDHFGEYETSPSYNDRYDVNRDGAVALADFQLVVLHFGQSCT